MLSIRGPVNDQKYACLINFQIRHGLGHEMLHTLCKLNHHRVLHVIYDVNISHSQYQEIGSELPVIDHHFSRKNIGRCGKF